MSWFLTADVLSFWLKFSTFFLISNILKIKCKVMECFFQKKSDYVVHKCVKIIARGYSLFLFYFSFIYRLFENFPVGFFLAPLTPSPPCVYLWLYIIGIFNQSKKAKRNPIKYIYWGGVPTSKILTSKIHKY